MQIIFSVPGRISGKGRARFNRHTGVAYTPAKTAASEAMLREIAAEAMGDKPLLEGPLALNVTVAQQIPKSWSKKRKATAYYITGRPDCDNVLKLIADALNHVCWTDDSQIAELLFRRRYSDGREEIIISVSELSKSKDDKNWIPRKIEQR